MDDISQAAPSPVPSPAKGKGKKSSSRGVKKAKKTAAKKGNRGRGGRRNKVYADARVQAAHERQQDLSILYNEVAKAIKPALEEVADSSIKALQEDPTFHHEFAEYWRVQEELDRDLASVIASADLQYSTGLSHAIRTLELDSEATRTQFQVSCITITLFSRSEKLTSL